MTIPNEGPFFKDPDDRQDFEWDWTDRLAQQSDTITTSEFLVGTFPGDTAPLTVDDDAKTTLTATVWLTCGTPGYTYEVTNRITTAAGRQLDRTRNVIVQQL